MNPIENRARFFTVMSGSLAVLTAYDEVQLSGDMAAPFLQESNFFWLTGIKEAGWKLILDGAQSKAILVRPQRSQIQIIFDGGTNDSDIAATSGISEFIDEDEFEKQLRSLSRKHSMVMTLGDERDQGFWLNPAPQQLRMVLGRIFSNVSSCRLQLAELRAIKSQTEIVAIKKAIDLTIGVFDEVRKNLESYQLECEIEADMTRYFRRVDADHAYQPIVASGKNAVTLHYTENRAKAAKNKMILIDVGARLDGYAADITRTYAVRPTRRQKEVHNAVTRAQQQIIELLGPNVAVADYIRQADEIMKDALIALGLLDDRSDDEKFRRYFPHAISHGLGIDVHDSLGAPRFFRPGMVLTVEPGIYIADEEIGVRIEDDILITKDGYENLSLALSREL